MKKLNGDTINKYLNENIKTIYTNITKSSNNNIGKEENFRTDMAIILNKIFSDLQIQEKVTPEQEYSVYKGRIDSLYGNIIIEYKAPNKINNNINSSSNKEFIEQVKRQIIGLSTKNNVVKEKILGTI